MLSGSTWYLSCQKLTLTAFLYSSRELEPRFGLGSMSTV